MIRRSRRALGGGSLDQNSWLVFRFFFQYAYCCPTLIGHFSYGGCTRFLFIGVICLVVFVMGCFDRALLDSCSCHSLQQKLSST